MRAYTMGLVLVVWTLPVNSAFGTIISVTPLDAAALFEDGGPWTIDSGSQSLTTQRSSFSDFERRGIMEFSLIGLPADAVITSATFRGDTILISYPPDPQTAFHGYAADGLLAPSDAQNPFNLVGTSPVITTMGVWDIPIDTAFVQSLVGNSSHLGLLTTAVIEGSQHGIASVEFADIAPFEPPTLTIEYTPEPTSLLLLGLGSLGLIRRKRDRPSALTS